MKERYTVGEFSKLFGLNVQTLRYYDAIGLFRPVFRDEWTGRRYYSFDQVYKLASIRYMRRLGHSLQEIESYFDSLTSDTSLSILKKRSEEINRQVNQLLHTDRVIQRKIQYIENEVSKIQDINEIRIVSFSERKYIPLGIEDTLYNDDSFYFFPTIAFYSESGKTFGSLIYSPDQAYDETEWAQKSAAQIRSIPGGKFLSGYHRGSYETVLKTANSMRAAYPGLRFEDRLVNFNIIDQFVEKDRTKYVTNLQIPILED